MPTESTVTAGRTATRHPLDPLTAEEVTAATAILGIGCGLDPVARFVDLMLFDESCQLVAAHCQTRRMQLRYAYRLDPTPGQRVALARVFGCARVVFNDALWLRETAYAAGEPWIPDAVLLRRVVTEAKRTPQRAWLGEVSAVVLQQAVADLNTAYRNFFASISGERQGPKVGPPRFRSRKDARQAIRFTRNARFAITPGGKLRLPKIGEVKVHWSRPLPAVPSSVTVIKDAAGRYTCSFVIQVDPDPLPVTDTEVGLDLGLTHFAVLCDGTKISSPRFLRRAEKRLKKAQRQLSRKQRGSNNRAKARAKLAKAHAHVADARRDFHHKQSTTLIRENQAVYVEDLAVAGLSRTRLAKSVADAGWGQFTGMLEYKANRYGRTFAKIDRWAPTSQTCSVCGVKDGPKPLSVRSWTCRQCETVHDRDVNAARNVHTAGRGGPHAATCGVSACGPRVRPAARLAPRATPSGEEAGTHPKTAA